MNSLIARVPGRRALRERMLRHKRKPIGKKRESHFQRLILSDELTRLQAEPQPGEALPNAGGIGFLLLDFGIEIRHVSVRLTTDAYAKKAPLPTGDEAIIAWDGCCGPCNIWEILNH